MRAVYLLQSKVSVSLVQGMIKASLRIASGVQFCGGTRTKVERVDALPVLLAGRLYYKKQSTNELSSPITYLSNLPTTYFEVSCVSSHVGRGVQIT